MHAPIKLRIREQDLNRDVEMLSEWGYLEGGGTLADIIENWDEGCDPNALWTLFAQGSAEIDQGCGASCTLQWAAP